MPLWNQGGGWESCLMAASHKIGSDRWENCLVKPLVKTPSHAMLLGGSQGIPPRFRSYGGSSFACGNMEGLQGAMVEPFPCKES